MSDAAPQPSHDVPFELESQPGPDATGASKVEDQREIAPDGEGVTLPADFDPAQHILSDLKEFSPEGDHQLILISDEVIAHYYHDLRRLARKVMRSGDRITLQPTELAHVAAVRLMQSNGAWVRDEAHLLALAARVIRLTFVDEIRRRKAEKRSFEAVATWMEPGQALEVDVLRFDEVLSDLSRFEPEGAQIVELRFYAGLSMKEISAALGKPERTIHRRWASARAWLLRELQMA